MIRFRKVIAYTLLLLTPVFVYGNDQSSSERQEQFMVVYLLHFSNFIEWPLASFQDSKHFNICLSANSKLNKYTDELNGESVKNRLIKVLPLSSNTQTAHCQILFIDKSSADTFERIKSSNTLLVSDQLGFSKNGGGIEYFIEKNKLRIAINLKATKDNGLTVSSKLLRIATLVQ
jgi:hypothetical protein